MLGHNFPGSEWYIDTYEIVEGVDFRERVDADGDGQPMRREPGFFARLWPF